MSSHNRNRYDCALRNAMMHVQHNNADLAELELVLALRAANTSKDRRYRRAVFRALNFTRSIPHSR